jgi:ubiquitin-protein ligase
MNKQYFIKEFYYIYDDHKLVKTIKKDLELILIDGKINISIESGYGYSNSEIPIYYNGINLIYNQKIYDFYKFKIWTDLKTVGDGFQSGKIFGSYNTFTEGMKIAILPSSNHYGNIETHYLSRLDVVKKLFDSFINRCIAYSFNTAIGLISFSTKSEVECEISPFYETFRNNLDNLYAEGETALYNAIKDASEKLILWKKADLEKRGKANLRIICLSDGHDTESSYDTKYDIEKILVSNKIILDCIAIGSEYDTNLGSLSKKTGGYMFSPKTIEQSLNIMELETMMLSNNRDKLQQQYYNYSGTIKSDIIPPIKNPNKLLKDKSNSIELTATKIVDEGKRLQRELINISKNPHPDIDVYVNESNLYFWKVVFSGPDGTPYKNGCWLAYMEFTDEYPYVPPKIRFVTEIKHCNINNYGRVCHSILDRNYTSNISIQLILQCVYGLLLNPDVSDPLDTNLALSYYNADGTYEAQIMVYVDKYAKKTREEWKKELS